MADAIGRVPKAPETSHDLPSGPHRIDEILRGTTLVRAPGRRNGDSLSARRSRSETVATHIDPEQDQEYATLVEAAIARVKTDPDG